MKRLDSLFVGIDQGMVDLFSDFENNGEMWSGQGSRIKRTAVVFSQAYTAPPAVTVGLSMLDIANSANLRVDLQAENVSTTGFEIVFRTWEDTQIARVRVAWHAIGGLKSDDNWDL